MYDAGTKRKKIDRIDLKIISLLMRGRSNKEIAKILKIPLSTIQRRTRRIFENNTVRNRVEPNFQQLGLSKGLLHVYVNSDAAEIAEKLSHIDNVMNVSLHIGNSDIVGEIVYKDRYEILKLISGTKKIPGVERVVWSEEVYTIPSNNSKFDLSAYLPKKLSDMLF